MPYLGQGTTEQANDPSCGGDCTRVPVYLGKRPVDFGTGLRRKEREKVLCFADRNDQRHERSVMAKRKKIRPIIMGLTFFYHQKCDT